MFVTCNRIFVNPDYRDAFEERFSTRAGLVETMPGFVSFHLLRPTQDGDPYVVMTFWQSYDHFNAWTESEAFRQGHGRTGTLPQEAFTAPTKLETFEVVEKKTP